MSDDELDRRLRAVRPPTAAEGWTSTPAGDEVLRDVLAAPVRPATRLRRHATVGAALLAAAAVTVALAVGVGDDGTRPDAPQANRGTDRPATQAVPDVLSLVSYDSCATALAGLRTQAARNIDAYRAASSNFRLGGVARLPVATQGRAASDAVEHSTTNNQETGIDEPDVVKTDGERVVSVADGVLRVTDVATRRTTGSLDVSMYAGAHGAQLLVDGDRALVVLTDADSRLYSLDRVAPSPQTSTYLLVDLAPARPKIVSTFRPRGGFVDARLVDGRVRLVVSSTPTLVAPQATSARLATSWRASVARAPVTAWLPGWTITTGGTTSTGGVPCTALRHPADYTGARLTSVYTVDLSGADGFGDLQPATLAADGSTVYATARSLYLTSQGAPCPASASCAARNPRTEIHRFDITGAGAPRYLGSGSVAGNLLDAYSLSEYRGSLRVVTTTGGRVQSSSVVALDADTLTRQGAVGGLGRNEQVHGVRFAGPLAYLVTFRTTDPLYVVDLTDPRAPVAAGQLKVTGFSDYLHLVGPGRVLGVGSEASTNGEVTGAQVSLFDVADPARPSRLDRVFRKNADTSDVADPHAFQYWAPTRTAFVPLQQWNSDDGRSRLLVLRVGTDSLRPLGELDNPTVPSRDGYDSGIVRTLVIDGSIWTMSSSGLQVSSLTDLKREAWIAF